MRVRLSGSTITAHGDNLDTDYVEFYGNEPTGFPTNWTVSGSSPNRVLKDPSGHEFSPELRDPAAPSSGGSGLPAQWTDGGHGDVTATTDDGTKTAISVKGTAGQTANLLRIVDENNNVVGYIDPKGVLTVAPSDATVDDLVNIVVPATYVNDSNYGRMLRMAFASMGPSEYIYSFGLDKLLFLNAPGEGEASIVANSSDSGGTVQMSTGSGFAFEASAAAATLLNLSIPALLGLRALCVEPTVGAAIFGAKSLVDVTALFPSEFTFYLDPTNGAAKLMIKGKSADGTVVTGSVNLT